MRCLLIADEIESNYSARKDARELKVTCSLVGIFETLTFSSLQPNQKFLIRADSVKSSRSVELETNIVKFAFTFSLNNNITRY